MTPNLTPTELRRIVAVKDEVVARWCITGQHAGLSLGNSGLLCPVCTPFYDSFPAWADELVWINGDG